ncbi:hypothetical protein SG34_003440 [Thalassomonas viridans]|uniref:Uncharacterized protein n=1 Tax=Thalassomonas viridans TaxID=137584 RepID=A0AAF0C839_9GAMM|nr:hypothetical protein [Thalassomonas viridans]WDE05997.1 hypothetical protein SG34_003440 [Thalassomonas viridans]
MNDSTNTPDNEADSITGEFLKLTDDFAAFSADCTFFCETFATLAEAMEDFNDYTSYGVRRYSDNLTEQVTNLDQRIHALQRRMREEL